MPFGLPKISSFSSAKYEALQVKVGLVREARSALDEMRLQELEQDMLSRMQIEQKLELMRQQKAEYLAYQQRLQAGRQTAIEQQQQQRTQYQRPMQMQQYQYPTAGDSSPYSSLNYLPVTVASSQPYTSQNNLLLTHMLYHRITRCLMLPFPRNTLLIPLQVPILRLVVPS